MRGLAVAALGAALPVAAHVAAGGSVSVPVVALLPLALAAALCVTASAKTWTVARLTAALAAMGVVTHTALWMGHSPPADGASSPLLTHHGSLGVAPLGSPALQPADSGSESAGGFLSALFGLTPAMTVAHVAAVALSVVLLRHGETFLLWLWSLAQRIFTPGESHVAAPRTFTFTAGRRVAALACHTGIAGGPRAPPQLV